MPGVAYLAQGELGILMGPNDYSHTETLAYGVNDFDVIWGESSDRQDELLVLRGGRVEWWKWQGAPGNGYFSVEIVEGAWGTPVRVTARGPNAGGYGFFAVLDDQNHLFLCLLISDGYFWFQPGKELGTAVIDMAFVDLDNDGLPEIGIQTAQAIRVFDFYGRHVLHHPRVAEKGRLFKIEDVSRERLLSVVQNQSSMTLLVLDEQGVEPQRTLLGNGFRSADVFDLDGDRNDDLVVSSDWGTEYVSLPANSPKYIASLPPQDGLALVDFDWDGDGDLLGVDHQVFRRVLNETLEIAPPQTEGIILEHNKAHVIFESAGGAEADTMVVTLWRRSTADGPVDPVPVGSAVASIESLPTSMVVEFDASVGSELVAEIRPLGELVYAATVGEVADPVPPPPDPREEDTSAAAEPPPTIPIPYVPPFTGGTPLIPWW